MDDGYHDVVFEEQRDTKHMELKALAILVLSWVILAGATYVIHHFHL